MISNKHSFMQGHHMITNRRKKQPLKKVPIGTVENDIVISQVEKKRTQHITHTCTHTCTHWSNTLTFYFEEIFAYYTIWLGYTYKTIA